MITRTVASESVEETAAIATQLAKLLQAGDRIALHGELGAGKTTFVRELAAALGVEAGLASSPTFVLANEYPIPSVKGETHRPVSLWHVDAYRLGDEDAFEELGIDDETLSRAALLVEWAERVPGVLGESHLSIRMGHAGPTSRSIVFAAEAGSSWAMRVESL